MDGYFYAIGIVYLHVVRRCPLYSASFLSLGVAVHPQGHQGGVLSPRDLPPPHPGTAAYEHEGESQLLSTALMFSVHPSLFCVDRRIGANANLTMMVPFIIQIWEGRGGCS